VQEVNLVVKGRCYVFEGPLKVSKLKGTNYAFLFSDILLLCKEVRIPGVLEYCAPRSNTAILQAPKNGEEGYAVTKVMQVKDLFVHEKQASSGSEDRSFKVAEVGQNMYSFEVLLSLSLSLI